MDSINQSGTNCSRDAPDSFGNPNNLSTHSWDASLVPFHDIRSNEFAAFEAGFVSPSSQQQLRYEMPPELLGDAATRPLHPALHAYLAHLEPHPTQSLLSMWTEQYGTVSVEDFAQIIMAQLGHVMLAVLPSQNKVAEVFEHIFTQWTRPTSISMVASDGTKSTTSGEAILALQQMNTPIGAPHDQQLHYRIRHQLYHMLCNHLVQVPGNRREPFGATYAAISANLISGLFSDLGMQRMAALLRDRPWSDDISLVCNPMSYAASQAYQKHLAVADSPSVLLAFFESWISDKTLKPPYNDDVDEMLCFHWASNSYLAYHKVHQLLKKQQPALLQHLADHGHVIKHATPVEVAAVILDRYLSTSLSLTYPGFLNCIATRKAFNKVFSLLGGAGLILLPAGSIHKYASSLDARVLKMVALTTHRIHAIGTTRFVKALEVFHTEWGNVFGQYLDTLSTVLYEPLILGKGLPTGCSFSQWESFVHMVREVVCKVTIA